MFFFDFKNLCALIHLSLVAGVNHVQEMKMTKMQTGGFKWNNCNNKVYPMNFTSLTIQPDPILPGKDITASFETNVSEDIGMTNTLRADFEMVLTTQGTRIYLCSYKQLSQYCHIENVCKILKEHREKCRKLIDFLHIDCKCPLKKNIYKLPILKYPIPDAPIEGLFRMKMNITESNKVMGCLEVEMCLRSC